MKTWQEMQRRHDELKKVMTCPVCGKTCNQFLSPGKMTLPMIGFLGHGQWYCCSGHWMKDPNSSYHKRKESSNGTTKT